MSVHDVCTLYAGSCLRSISSVFPWYPLVGIPIGVHSPHSARLGHPSRLKIGTLARLLPDFNFSEEVFAMDILAETDSHSARAIRSSPSRWLVANRCVVTKTCRKKAKLVATPLVSFGRLRLKRSLPMSVSSRFRPSPAKKDNSAGHILAARAGQCSTTCTTVTVSVPHNRHVVSSSVRTHRRTYRLAIHRTYCIPGRAHVAAT